jgi:hypothetical protein
VWWISRLLIYPKDHIRRHLSLKRWKLLDLVVVDTKEIRSAQWLADKLPEHSPPTTIHLAPAGDGSLINLSATFSAPNSNGTA